MTNTLLIIVLVLLLVFMILIFVGISKFLSAVKPVLDFIPKTLGTVKEVSNNAISKYIGDTGISDDEPRSLMIVSDRVLKGRKEQLMQFMKFYSLIDKKSFSELYQEAMNRQGQKAKAGDLGWTVLSQLKDGILTIYSIWVTNLGQPIIVEKKEYSSPLQASQYINDIYKLFKHPKFDDYKIITINGPELPDIESFGMYEGALPQWLSTRTQQC